MKGGWGYSLSGLALFCAGYWTGHTKSAEKVVFAEERSARSEERQARRSDTDARQTGKLSQRPTEKYARLMGLIADGKLRVSGVDFRGDTLMPGDEVKEFFGLTQAEFDEMKQMGRTRLLVRQDREAAMAVVRSSSEDRIEFELPADPTFAETQASEYIEDLSHRFGPQVAGVLGQSVKDAYGDLNHARIVKYTLSINESDMEMLRRTDLPKKIRDNMEGTRNYQMEQQSLDASGNIAPGITGSSGTLNLNDTSAEAHRPRYHFLWERRDKLPLVGK